MQNLVSSYQNVQFDIKFLLVRNPMLHRIYLLWTCIFIISLHHPPSGYGEEPREEDQRLLGLGEEDALHRRRLRHLSLSVVDGCILIVYIMAF